MTQVDAEHGNVIRPRQLRPAQDRAVAAEDDDELAVLRGRVGVDRHHTAGKLGGLLDLRPHLDAGLAELESHLASQRERTGTTAVRHEQHSTALGRGQAH